MSFYETDSISTQNLTPTTIATPLSSVTIVSHEMGSLSVSVTGTYTGVLSIQMTVDDLVWETVGFSCLKDATTGVLTTTIPTGATGIYQVVVAGASKIRVTALAAVTGTAVVTLKGGTVTQVDSTGEATAAKQDLLLTELQLKADLTETQPVSAASLPLPSGAATSANQSTEITSLASIDLKQTVVINVRQTLSFNATSAQCTTFNALTKRVVLTTTQDCWFLLGSNPTAVKQTATLATATGIFLPAGGMTYPLFVTGGTDKVAVVMDSVAGFMSIQESL